MRKLLLILFFIQPLLAQVKSQSYVDRKNVYLGDIFEYNIILEHPENINIEKFEIYDVLKDTAGAENFILLDAKVKKRKKLLSKNIKEKYIFKLIPIKIGKLQIAEFNVNYTNKTTQGRNSILIPKIEVEVVPYPRPKNKKFDGEIVDIKPQIWIRNFLWLIFIGFALLGILFWIFYQYRLKPEYQQNFSAEQQQLDIKEVALSKLESLWQKDYITKGLIKEFYLELTEIVRWYIEKKFNVNALESTTEELYNLLKKKVDKKYNLKLRSFLENADLAKFAKYTPQKEQIVKDFETAKELIN
jgi:hypothetical protein